ncbi:DUF885 family protein [Solimonas sp. SE-A11]|uniref:DUF885 domain-containing protein n=1 Tax=Solimonas sp. SE-A11 TaxID=3054954 RepID=UPI00259C796A|nr:DUF885 domain-containing protein [Solimonas sp. SE-A11]MDM4769909.1 DUF885 domain-containing protein [Solimonas sp. SE-A11]
MPLYQPSSQERSLLAVNKASELANSVISNCIFWRVAQGKPIEGSLPDISEDGAGRRAAKGREILQILEGVDEGQLPHEFVLTARLTRFFAQAWSKDADRYWLAVDVMENTFYGPFVQTPYTGGFLFNEIRKALGEFVFQRDSDGDRYLVLLAEVTQLLRQIHARTAGQAERGIRIHKLQLPGSRRLLAGLRAAAAASYPVQGERLAALSGAGAIATEIQRRLEQSVLPAFDALIEQLDETYESLAPEGVGMDKLPGGREVYADLVRMHTTMSLSPEQVHAAGHARMARIQAEMAEVRQKLGFAGTEAEFALHLRRQPGAVAASAEDIGRKMRRHKDRVEQRFEEFFAQRSPWDYDLERLPEALESGMTWGYYSRPVGNEKRGLYYYNGSKLDSQAVIAAAALTFHELVPGHHLHLTLQMSNPDLSDFRRTCVINAFNEGWAEYAAMLAGEMGLYDDPYDRYGRLSQDAFLTCRLVVDTGMNTLGWSWDQARQYMREHTLCAEGEIDSDTLRYSCGIPAQSLAYKLGDEEILRMRRKLQDRLGERFSFRDFHSAVLGCGALPLPTLEWHLDQVFPETAA